MRRLRRHDATPTGPSRGITPPGAELAAITESHLKYESIGVHQRGDLGEDGCRWQGIGTKSHASRFVRVWGLDPVKSVPGIG